MNSRLAYWGALCISGAGGSLIALHMWIAGLCLVAGGILLSMSTEGLRDG